METVSWRHLKKTELCGLLCSHTSTVLLLLLEPLSEPQGQGYPRAWSLSFLDRDGNVDCSALACPAFSDPV